MKRADRSRLLIRRGWRRFRRLIRLPLRDQLSTLHAFCALVVTELLIRWVRLPRLAALAGVSLAVAPREPCSGGGTSALWSGRAGVDDSASVRVDRAVRSVRRVVRTWPFGAGSCLRESLVLGHLLRSRSPILRVGVTSVDQLVAAHAWLEVDGRRFGEQPGFVELRGNWVELSGDPKAFGE